MKSAAYVQSWRQKCPSRITFGIAPTLGWDPGTGDYDTVRRRQAQVYVFSILGEKDQVDVDPLDVSQWTFYVIPTDVLNRRLGEQKTMGLSTLLGLGTEMVTFGEIGGAVERAGGGGR